MLGSPATSILFAGGLSRREVVAVSRSLPPAWSLLAVVLLGTVAASPASAQASGDRPDRAPDGLPPALADAIRAYRQAQAPEAPPDPQTELSVNKELARAKFEAIRADPAALARQKLEAARLNYRARLEEFLAGRGALQLLSAASLRLTEAEQAVRDRPEDQAAALEGGWERAWVVETITAGRFASGRAPTADYAETTYLRLEAEARWLRARARAGKGGRPGTGRGLPQRGADVVLAEGLRDSGVRLADLAEVKRAALQADPRDRARQTVAAARACHRARFEEFEAGRGTLDSCLDSEERLAEAARAGRPEDGAAAFETSWARAWETERIEEARFHAGRVPLADYLEARQSRLGAEVRWLRSGPWPGAGRERALGRGLFPEDELGPTRSDVAAFSRAKREALQAAPRQLERERRAVLREAYGERWKEFVSGRGTLYLLLAASRQWLEAELAVLDRPAEQAAACERHWTRSKRAEMVNDARFQSGRVPIADLMETRYARLDAEIRWAEARERAAREKK
jgi:hypothetical protein